MTTNGTVTALYSFTGVFSGANPHAGLTLGSDGSFYGTTLYGGITNSTSTNGMGTIFRVTTNGTLTTLYSFTGDTNGANPDAELIQGNDGNLYGTTSAGGDMNLGTVFSLSLPPVITVQPQSQTKNAGATVTFLVSATSLSPITYQWQKNGTNLVDGSNLSGATNSTLTITSVSNTDAAIYTAVVSDAHSSVTTSNAVLTVVNPPSITAQPATQIVAAGSNVTFTVSATGDAPLGYQWLFNSGKITAATNDTYLLPNSQSFNAGNYSVVVSNAFGSITSSIATLTVIVPPTISSQPQGQTAYKGVTVQFSVGVNGTAPVFQWFKDGLLMPGQTNVSLLFPSVQTNDTGSYSMTASNFAGKVTSSNALLIVQDVAVQFVTVSGNGQVITNAETTFGVSVTIQMTTVFSNGVIYYTLDGTPPDFYSTPYSGPVALTHSATLRAVGYSADFLQAGFAGPFTINVNVIPVYTVTLSNHGGGTVSLTPASGPYASNTVVSLVATPASGWTLLQWLGDLTGNSLSNYLVMNSPKYVEAVFGTTLGTTVAGNGAVYLQPPGGVYPYGTQVKLYAAPGVGSFFSFWGNAGSGTNNPLVFTLTSPAPTVSSVFSPLAAGQYALGVIPLGLGQIAVSPARNTYTNGQSVTVTATPDVRQKLAGWSGDAGGSNNPLSVTMDQNKTIVANFTRNPLLSVTKSFEGMKPDGFHLTLSGQYGDRFDVLGSVNLTGWTTVGTITNNFGCVQFSDPDATNFTSRFYRAFMQ